MELSQVTSKNDRKKKIQLKEEISTDETLDSRPVHHMDEMQEDGTEALCDYLNIRLKWLNQLHELQDVSQKEGVNVDNQENVCPPVVIDEEKTYDIMEKHDTVVSLKENGKQVEDVKYYSQAEVGSNVETGEGAHETVVSEIGEEDLQKIYASCNQNPGHISFVPLKDFNIDQLPAGYNDNDLVEFIKAASDLTVRVAVNITSTETPEFRPHTHKPYPFCDTRRIAIRLGTGMMEYVDKLSSEDTNDYNKNHCRCHKCQTSGTPSKEWGKVMMSTATHVVFDDLEARHTSCTLYSDVENTKQVTLDGWRVVKANIEEDQCLLEYVTCDKDLLDKLDKKMRHRLDSWEKLPRDKKCKLFVGQKTTERVSDVENLTKRLNENMTFLVKKTGHKLQIKRTTPKQWIRLNLKFTRDVPVENENCQYPTSSGSATQEANEVLKEALTCVLLMNVYMKELFKKIELKSNEDDSTECVKTMFDEFQRVSEKIITMNAMMTNDFLTLYKDLVSKSEDINTAFKSGEWSAPIANDLIETTEEDLLCNVVGLSPNLAQSLKCLDKFDKSHQLISYYIQKWFINRLYGRPNISEDCSAYVDGNDLEKAFVAMDFSAETAKAIVSSIGTEFQGTQTIMYWALKHTDHMFSSHILLSKDTYADYQPGRKNEWFSEDIDRPQRCEPKVNPTLQKSIFMINVSGTADNITFSEKDIIEKCQPGTELWYHGTNTYAAAHSILKEGIKLSEGSKKQDFSNTNGFYVSNNFKAANKLAHRHSTYGCAVVVFKMNIESSDWTVLDLANDNETWRKVIRYHRSGGEKEEEFSVSIPDEFNPVPGEPIVMRHIHIDEFDCIRGLICSNIEQILHNDTDDEANTGLPVFKIDNVPVQQICVKEKDLAKYFGSLGNICAVIWFPAN